MLVFFLCCAVCFGGEVAAESKPRGKITIRHVQKDDGFLREKKLGHPAKLDPMSIKRTMWDLHFLGKLTVTSDTWEDPERVFDKETIALASGRFVKKLGAVKPGEIVHFSIYTKRGETSGDVFVLGHALNWRFSRIQGMDRLVDHQSVAQETGGEILVNWKLEPRKKQKYFYSENTLGFKTRYDYWVTVPIKEPKASGSGVGVSTGRQETLPADGSTTKEKLKTLKEWKEESLISEEDYKKKVKQLLEQF
jgi:hypothetical protein